MLRSRLLVLPVVLLGWVVASASSLPAAVPVLLRDVNPSPNPDLGPGPALRDFVTVGARALFIVQNRNPEASFAEIWASDGTDGGTERLRGFGDDAGVTLLGATAAAAFYQVIEQEPVVGRQTYSLWRSDGTAAGTFPLAEPMQVSEALAWNGKLLFRGCVTARDCEPWVSDGTQAGTRRLRDITPGPYGSQPRNFTPFQSLAWFLADSPAGPGLWRTDGTPAGTRRAALLPATALVRGLVATESRLFWVSGPDVGSIPKTLWTSDGTGAGTRRVAPFTGTAGKPSVLKFLGAIGGIEIFAASDPVQGIEIWRTDGTPQGTFAVTAFTGTSFIPYLGFPLGDRLLVATSDRTLWTVTGERGSAQRLNCGEGCTLFTPLPGQITVMDGQAFFTGASRDAGAEPWVTDGTQAGTHRIVDLCRGACSSNPLFGPAIDDQALFYADGNLWGTDGTLAGTRLLAIGAIAPGNTGLELTGNTVAAAGPRLVFSGYDKSFPPDQLALQLKSTVDSPATERVIAAHLADGASSNPRQFTPLRGGAVFIACSNQGDFWWTGGTPETTIPLVPLEQARLICDDPSAHFVVLDGIAYFRALGKDAYWYELWRTDGTPAGTYPITENEPGHDVWAFTAFHGKLLYATNDAYPPEGALSTFWTTDGTPDGEVKLFQAPMAFVSDLTVAGDRLLFLNNQLIDGDNGLYLSISDGTLAGTVTLRRVGGSAVLQDVAELNGQIVLLTVSNFDGVLWRTDGTPDGTIQFAPAAYRIARILDMALFKGSLYFMALNIPPDHGEEAGVPTLFRTDGTAAGTVPVHAFSKDEAYILGFAHPHFAVAGGSLFFAASDGVHGTELWRSDGTAAGTVQVRDINPGPATSRVDNLTAAGNRVYFSADDGVHGVELWTSDGTAAGTAQVADVSPGPASSLPRELAVLDSRLFFSADDGVVGREPWVLTLDKMLPGGIIP